MDGFREFLNESDQKAIEGTLEDISNYRSFNDPFKTFLSRFKCKTSLVYRLTSIEVQFLIKTKKSTNKIISFPPSIVISSIA